MTTALQGTSEKSSKWRRVLHADTRKLHAAFAEFEKLVKSERDEAHKTQGLQEIEMQALSIPADRMTTKIIPSTAVIRDSTQQMEALVNTILETSERLARTEDDDYEIIDFSEGEATPEVVSEGEAARRTFTERHWTNVFVKRMNRMNADIPEPMVPVFTTGISQWKQCETPLGKGATGVVFAAEVEGGLIAVKTLYGNTQTDILSFRRECVVFEKVGVHRNIVRFLGADEETLAAPPCRVRRLFLELVSGSSLWQIVRVDFIGGIPEAWCKAVTRQMLDGLTHLSQKLNSIEVVHRDIKSSNVLVSNEGIVKLADFGISKFFADLVPLQIETQASFTGTFGYMSPECMYNLGGYTKKADIWSLGCVIVEMMTGKSPWAGDENELYFSNLHMESKQRGRRVDSVRGPVLAETVASEALRIMLKEKIFVREEQRADAEEIRKETWVILV
ncbi:kinase-like domain-containing protein [Mycena vitilis]|nr:kinase-like domain-containing protein [Mycena vitilis]